MCDGSNVRYNYSIHCARYGTFAHTFVRYTIVNNRLKQKLLHAVLYFHLALDNPRHILHHIGGPCGTLPAPSTIHRHHHAPSSCVFILCLTTRHMYHVLYTSTCSMLNAVVGGSRSSLPSSLVFVVSCAHRAPSHAWWVSASGMTSHCITQVQKYRAWCKIPYCSVSRRFGSRYGWSIF